MQIKIGNSIDLLFTAQDRDGNIVQNLNTATSIKFIVKVNEIDDDSIAKISKDLTLGIIIDTPSIGNIKVSLSSIDTTVLAGIYFMALQIAWDDVIQELTLKETIDEVTIINTINFVQDIIR